MMGGEGVVCNENAFREIVTLLSIGYWNGEEMHRTCEYMRIIITTAIMTAARRIVKMM